MNGDSRDAHCVDYAREMGEASVTAVEGGASTSLPTFGSLLLIVQMWGSRGRVSQLITALIRGNFLSSSN
jgi:hypothetical protein